MEKKDKACQEYETREASHADSWYSADKDELDEELTEYLKKAKRTLPEGAILKALIGPHAGFMFSGPTAAYAYKNVDPEKYDRVFLLGPSHHAYLDGCALS
jgi:AmmeMemoRadiSam system protein B